MIEPVTLSGGAKIISIMKTIFTFGRSASIEQGGKYFKERYPFYCPKYASSKLCTFSARL